MGLVIKNACIITNDQDVVIPDGYIRVKDNIIVEMGKMSAYKAAGGDQVIDAFSRVLMPGFVNPHMHLYSRFATGMKVPKMMSFLEILESFWWKMDKVLKEEDVYISALVGIILSIRAGVTTIFDHHASYGCTKGSLLAVSEAFAQTGMRGVLCYEVSDRNGEKDADKAIHENVDFLEEVAEKCISQSYLLRGMFGLHASFTLSNATLKKVREANSKLDAPYHLHVAEGFEDAEDSKSRYNTSVVRRLRDEGIIREGTIAAHCIHVNDIDMGILKDAGAFVVHNPVSNMNNAVGRAPYIKMCKSGLPVGIGTDGMSASIYGDVRTASVCHKEAADDPQAGWLETKESTLGVNPRMASHVFGQRMGVIKTGSVADVIISNYIPHTTLAAGNYWGHVLYGVMNASVHTTVVNGRVLLQDHKLVGIDEASALNEARKLSAQMWKRFENK